MVYSQCRRWVVAGLVGGIVSGCASGPKVATMPEVSALGRGYSSVLSATGEGDPLSKSKQATLTGVINLNDVLTLALLQNPELEGFAYDVRAADARAMQADRGPNPQLGLELEEFDRDGAGMDSAERVVSLGQVIELGGKRSARRRLAANEAVLAVWDYECQRLEVFAASSRRFAECVAAQSRYDLSMAAVALARQTANAVAERVKAGKEPDLQAAKAEAERELAGLDLLDASAARDLSRQKLAAVWGASSPAFSGLAEGEQGVLKKIPVDLIMSRLNNSPEWKRLEATRAVKEAALEAEQSAAVPDLEAQVGFQSFEEDGSDALTFGVGIELPLRDRNKGNIAAARNDLRGLSARVRAEQLDLRSDLLAGTTSLVTAHKKVSVLRGDVLPAMTTLVDGAQEGYRHGKFSVLDLLDAQRTLFDVQERSVDALLDYSKAAAEVERVIGISLNELMRENSKKRK